MPNFKIKKQDEGKRLDLFLKEKYADLSRSFIQKKIKNGEARVNGEISAVHRFLKENDTIEIRNCLPAQAGLPAEASVQAGKLEIKNQKVDSSPIDVSKRSVNRIIGEIAKLDIISETDDYVVINKPCGMVVHPGDTAYSSPLYQGGDSLSAQAGKGFTLADILKEKYPKIKNVGEYPERPGIVHRLDKNVSGVMVIAKTQEMFMCLKKQFIERIIKKEYIALVYGIVEKPCGVIDFPIGRSKTERTKMAARPLNQGGRDAITEFTVLKHLAKWTLLSVKIKTGRMHQIRVHLNAYGHPIVGDKVYKPKKLKPTLKFGERLMLHSWHLGFCDLAGERKEFEAELPEEFRRIPLFPHCVRGFFKFYA